MKPQILLINDLAGYGKVALSAMMPILTHMGYNLYNLPTALVSNTLDYGKFEILDTTDYMKNTIQVWEELGFSFDAISTGFIVSDKQVSLLVDYCTKQAEKGTLIFCDPIMGDDCKLYNGVTPDTIVNMRRMCSVADYLVPNYTEAAFLTGTPCSDSITQQEADKLLEDTCRLCGGNSVAITSVPLGVNGSEAVIGYDAKQKESFVLPYEIIPVRFPGTGDIFSSVMLGELLRGEIMKDAVRKAMIIVAKLIAINKDNTDKYKGIPLESYLEVLDI